MLINKCDNCNKLIEAPNKTVNIGYGTFRLGTKEYCLSCGKKLLSKKGIKEIIEKK